MEIIMKTILGSLAILAMICMGSITSSAPVEAKGCIKGALVGGVVGHLAGHGAAGASAGCVIGHHEAAKKTKQRQETPTR
jgi:outer membrane lipoprotein SlyB